MPRSQDRGDEERSSDHHGERVSVLPYLLDQDDDGEPRHDRDVHGADRDQNDHQPPATRHAVGAVVDPDAEVASRTSEAGVVEQRSDRRATVAEARLLQRRELVDARDGEDRGADPLRRIGRRIDQMPGTDERDVGEQPEAPPRRPGSRPGTARRR